MTVKEMFLPIPSVKACNSLNISFLKFINLLKVIILDKNSPLHLKLVILPLALPVILVVITILKIRCTSYKRKNPELFI